MAKTSRTRKTPKPNPADALTAINSDRVAQTTINSDRGRESVLLTRNTTHGYWRHIHWLYYNPTSLQKHYPLPETLGCCVLGILCIRDVATSPIHNIPTLVRSSGRAVAFVAARPQRTDSMTPAHGKGGQALDNTSLEVAERSEGNAIRKMKYGG